MMNNTFALESYKFFNAAGDGCFAMAVNSFVTSLEDRKMATTLLAVGALSKLMSMIPFYADEQVRDTQPHPISGTSYPAITGLVSAHLSALAGNTPASKAIGKVVSFFGQGALDYLNKTIVYETPSTLMCPNPECTEPPDDYSFGCENYKNKNGTCTSYKCYVRLDSWRYVQPTNSEHLASMAMHIIMIFQPIKYLDWLSTNTLQHQIHISSGDLQPLQQRIKIVVQSLLWMIPVFVHLTAMQFKGYRKVSIRRITPWSNMPYVLSVGILSFLKDFDIWIANLVIFGLPQLYPLVNHLFCYERTDTVVDNGRI